MIGRLLTALSVVAVAAASPAGAQQFTMKIGFVTQRDPIEAYSNKVKQSLEARSGGKIKVEIYPAVQLGPEPQLVKSAALQSTSKAAKVDSFRIGGRTARILTE